MPEFEDFAAAAQEAEALGFLPSILHREAVASVELDRDQTHVVGEVEARIELDDSKLRANLARAQAHLDRQSLTGLAGRLLKQAAGLDLESPHGRGTPERFVRMLQELTTPEEFKFTTFPAESQNMVMIFDIPFASVCSHHVIPFVGYAHVAYVPDKLIAGLSKFARLVKAKARSLQVQETLTMQIADAMEEILSPVGCMVVLEAEHLCMTIRGVQTPGAKTRTAEQRGCFADHSKTAKAEFLSALNNRRPL